MFCSTLSAFFTPPLNICSLQIEPKRKERNRYFALFLYLRFLDFKWLNWLYHIIRGTFDRENPKKALILIHKAPAVPACWMTISNRRFPIGSFIEKTERVQYEC